MSNTHRMEDTLERVRQARQTFKSGMQPSANEAAIKHLQSECETRFGMRVPERYCHLLRLADGVEWCSARFFGTESRAYVDHPDRILPSMLEKSVEQWQWLRKLVIGAIEDQYFCYDQNADEYQAYIVSDSHPYRRFKEFDELFAYAFEDRWPDGG